MNLKNFDFNSLKNVQNDIKSGFAKFLIEKILNVLKDEKLDKKEKKAIEILKRWDFSFDKNKVEPYIYSKIELKIIEKYFLPLLSDTLYKEFLDLFYIPLSSLEKNLRNGNIPDSIIISSFKESLKEIRFEKYGKYAKAKFKHPFSNNKFLKIFFTKGPISLSGGPETPNKMGWLLSKPFEIFEGPSMRMIIDFKKNGIYIVLPPGQSGNFFDKNSKNQLRFWEKGEYIKIEEKNFKNKLLILP
jgi:acyl-homoserine lactone acylase PvdQ